MFYSVDPDPKTHDSCVIWHKDQPAPPALPTLPFLGLDVRSDLGAVPDLLDMGNLVRTHQFLLVLLLLVVDARQ